MQRESLQVSYCWHRSDGGAGRAAQAVTVSSVVGAGQSEGAWRGGEATGSRDCGRRGNTAWDGGGRALSWVMSMLPRREQEMSAAT